jgi:acetyltransferase-like isoleucine patch superfamily enzyme
MEIMTQKNLQEQLQDSSQSAFSRYQAIAIGNSSLWYLIKFELIMLFVSGLPGALGFALRKIFYPTILGAVGSGVIFGRGITIRHGLKVHIGKNVTVDDFAALDAKGDENDGIKIGDNTIISRNVVLSCKGADITIGSGCTLGINSLVHALQGSPVVLGDDVLCGAYCYFIGSGPYITDELEVPFKKQGMQPKGGISIANNVWFGSNVQVMDGLEVATGSIIGSSAVVNKSIPEYSVYAGVPAKLVKKRS